LRVGRGNKRIQQLERRLKAEMSQNVYERERERERGGEREGGTVCVSETKATHWLKWESVHRFDTGRHHVSAQVCVSVGTYSDMDRKSRGGGGKAMRDLKV